MKLHEIQCQFLAEINGWWEWLPATIIDVDPTGSIAVKNRSHSPKTADIKLQSLFFDQTGRPPRGVNFSGRRQR
jgi:hypothetical protein